MVLSAALMVSMGVLVFVTGDNEIVASAAGTTGGTWITPTQWVSTESAGSAQDTVKTVVEKISERMDRDICMAQADGMEVAVIDGSQYGINSLSRDIIKRLSDVDMDARFSFDYDGNHYVITIPAGETPVSDDVLWYGPKYLISLYGDTASVTPLE